MYTKALSPEVLSDFKNSLITNDVYVCIGQTSSKPRTSLLKNSHYYYTDYVWDEMLFGIKLKKEHTKLGFDKNEWQREFYDYDVELNSVVSVFNSEDESYDIFRLIEKEDGLYTVTKPSINSLDTNDGHVWEYIISISKDDVNQFYSDTHLPIPNNISNELIYTLSPNALIITTPFSSNQFFDDNNKFRVNQLSLLYYPKTVNDSSYSDDNPIFKTKITVRDYYNLKNLKPGDILLANDDNVSLQILYIKNNEIYIKVLDTYFDEVNETFYNLKDSENNMLIIESIDKSEIKSKSGYMLFVCDLEYNRQNYFGEYIYSGVNVNVLTRNINFTIIAESNNKNFRIPSYKYVTALSPIDSKDSIEFNINLESDGLYSKTRESFIDKFNFNASIEPIGKIVFGSCSQKDKFNTSISIEQSGKFYTNSVSIKDSIVSTGPYMINNDSGKFVLETLRIQYDSITNSINIEPSGKNTKIKDEFKNSMTQQLNIETNGLLRMTNITTKDSITQSLTISGTGIFEQDTTTP